MESWEESEHPIEEETIEIGSKYIDEDATHEPETLLKWQIMPQEWLKKSLHMFHYEIACCVDKS